MSVFTQTIPGPPPARGAAAGCAICGLAIGPAAIAGVAVAPGVGEAGVKENQLFFAGDAAGEAVAVAALSFFRRVVFSFAGLVDAEAAGDAEVAGAGDAEASFFFECRAFFAGLAEASAAGDGVGLCAKAVAQVKAANTRIKPICFVMAQVRRERNRVQRENRNSGKW